MSNKRVKRDSDAARGVFGILLALLSVGPACLAQVSAFEGRMITDIQFSPAQPLAPQDLEKAQPLKKGEPLRAEDVAHAIDGLFATGRFEDIAVEAEAAGDGVRIRFAVKLALFVEASRSTEERRDRPIERRLKTPRN